VIWKTPVPQLILAIQGRYDYALKTNPFGAPKDKEKEKARKEKLDAQRTAFFMARSELRQKVKNGRRN